MPTASSRPFPHECAHRWIQVYADNSLVCQICLLVKSARDPVTPTTNLAAPTYVPPLVRQPWYLDLIRRCHEGLRG